MALGSVSATLGAPTTRPPAQTVLGAVGLLLPFLPTGVQAQEAEIPRTRSFSGLVAPPFAYAEPESVGISSEALDELGDEIADWITGGWHYDGDLVGAELLVVKNGRAVYHEAYGWSDREERVPVQRNSIWSIKSMSKPFTATAALILADEGKLSLDEPVSRYIATFPNDSARIRHLLAQTSGYGGDESDYDWTSLQTLVESWAADGPSRPQGVFHYSDFNFEALGYIVGEVSGTSIDRFTEDRIIEPLGLDDTSTGFSDDPIWRARLNPWYRWNEGAAQYDLRWATNREPWDFYNAAWGMFSTAMDYAEFMALWMNGGEWKGTRLLSAATVDEALSPQGAAEGTGLWTGVYGYGWFVNDIPPEDGRSFGHGGGDGTLAMAFPADDLIVVYMTHSRGGHHVAALVNRVYMSDLVVHPGVDPEFFPLRWANEVDVEVTELSAEERALYVGTYEAEEGQATMARISEDAGRLQLRYGPKGVKPDLRYHLVPVAEDLFALGYYEEDGRVAVSFDPPYRVRFLVENDEVRTLALHKGDDLVFRVVAR